MANTLIALGTASVILAIALSIPRRPTYTEQERPFLNGVVTEYRED